MHYWPRGEVWHKAAPSLSHTPPCKITTIAKRKGEIEQWKSLIALFMPPLPPSTHTHTHTHTHEYTHCLVIHATYDRKSIWVVVLLASPTHISLARKGLVEILKLILAHGLLQ